MDPYAAAKPSLMFTMPASSCDATFQACLELADHTDALRP